jgi:F-type H+-transporting ATPase subunit gamma
LAGAGLLDLKRRIKSVTNTQKITRAMGLVATAKFKKVRDRAEKTTPYFDKFHEAVTKMALSPDLEGSKYFQENDSDTDIYIVLTSDSGLCGSYNTNAILETVRHIDDRKVQLITVGEKARAFFTRRDYETLKEFVDLGDAPSYKDAVDIIRPAIEAFEMGKVKNVYITYTKFHSPVKQSVEILRMLPMERPEGEKGKDILFEPSSKEVFDYVMPKYISTTMFYSLVNSVASEYSSRMNAMDNATKNASEILDKLKLMYNRARQSSITQEITEIVSGAEALKG